MKALFISSSLSIQAGGIFPAMVELGKGLASQSVDVQAAGLNDASFKSSASAWEPLLVHTHKVIGPDAFGFAPSLNGYVLSFGPDVLHLHGLWMYPSMVAEHWVAKTHKPLVISPHGMLDPWALKNSPFKKHLAYWGYERANLQSAACLHALCVQEYQAIRAFGLKNPVAIIPNGVNLPMLPSRTTQRAKTLLFLGRLHPKKGLGPLIAAWKEAGSAMDGWQLKIVGLGELAYIVELKGQAQDININFSGAMYGYAKERAFREASAFILPSFSEGLPVAVLEAWSYGLPVVMTKACNLEIGFEKQAAIECSTDYKVLAGTLREVVAMAANRLGDIGVRGRNLVEEEFQWPKIASQMAAVYKWVLGQGPKPECVRED